MAGKGVKTSGSSFYGLNQWWAPSLPPLAEVTSDAPSSRRHKYAACTTKTCGNHPSATAAVSSGAPKPLLSSESLSKEENSAECSKLKCVAFLFKVAICLEILSRQQVPGAASRWCSGNPGKGEGISFLLQAWKTSDDVLEFFAASAISQW